MIKWISFADKRPTQIDCDFLCRFVETSYLKDKTIRQYFYTTHITPEGYFHIKGITYLPCFDVNTNHLIPTHWAPLPNKWLEYKGDGTLASLYSNEWIAGDIENEVKKTTGED